MITHLLTIKKLFCSSLAIALCLSASAMQKDPKGTLLFEKSPFSQCCIQAVHAKLNVKCAKNVQPQLTYSCCNCARCHFKAQVSGNTLVIKHETTKTCPLAGCSPCFVNLELTVPPSCHFKIDANQLQLSTNGEPLGDLKMDINQGTLQLNAECKNCKLDANNTTFECTKTIQGHLIVDSNTADIKVADVSGDCYFDTNKGTVKLSNCKNCTFKSNNGSFECVKKIQGKLIVRGNRTDIKVADITGNVKVAGNTAKMDLSYLALPKEAIDIKIRSNTLRSTLHLPQNAHVDSDIKTYKNHKNRVTNEAASAKGPVHFKIKARANTGSVEIQSTPPSAH